MILKYHKYSLYILPIFIIGSLSMVPQIYGSTIGDDSWPAPPPQYVDGTKVTCLNGDSDNDGLCNEWEYYSQLRIFDGTRTVTYTCDEYPAEYYCAHPYWRDAWIEVDSLVTHSPSIQAIDLMKSRFNVPARLVHLHIQVDDVEIDHNDAKLDVEPMSGDERGTGQDFMLAKQNYFGTINERLDSDLIFNKRQAFHYTFYAHKFSGFDEFKYGKAEIGGNDMALADKWFILFGGYTKEADTWEEELCHNFNMPDPIILDDCNYTNSAYNMNMGAFPIQFLDGPSIEKIYAEVMTKLTRAEELGIINQNLVNEFDDYLSALMDPELSPEDTIPIPSISTQSLVPGDSEEMLEHTKFLNNLVKFFDRGTRSESQTSKYFLDSPRDIPRTTFLRPPHNQIYKEPQIEITKIICGPDLEFLKIRNSTANEPKCIKFESFSKYVTRLQDQIVGDNSLCDANKFHKFYKEQGESWANPIPDNVIDNITNSTNKSKSKLDCKAYEEKYYLEENFISHLSQTSN